MEHGNEWEQHWELPGRLQAKTVSRSFDSHYFWKENVMLSLYWITFDRLDNMSTINIVLCHKQPQSADNEIEFDEFSATQKKKKKKLV